MGSLPPNFVGVNVGAETAEFPLRLVQRQGMGGLKGVPEAYAFLLEAGADPKNSTRDADPSAPKRGPASRR